jgi:hypothetical protein
LIVPNLIATGEEHARRYSNCMVAWHGCRPSKVKNHHVFWIGSLLLAG